MTAGEFLEIEHKAMLESIADGEQSYSAVKDFISIWLIEFAKLHVEAALKSADNAVDREATEGFWDYVFDKNFIINAYPLENIK